MKKTMISLSIRNLFVLLMLSAFNNTIAQTGNSENEQATGLVKLNATDTYNYAEKICKSENFADMKLYLQRVMDAAKLTKTNAIQAEKLLTEKEKEVSNSANPSLIENIKDQKEEIIIANEYAAIAYDYAEKALNAKDPESLQMFMKQVAKASKKVIRQTENTLHYSSLINKN